MWVAVKDRSEHSCIWRKLSFMYIYFFHDVVIFESNRSIASISLSDKVDRVCPYQLCL